MNFKYKYLKYKLKYLIAKKLYGGMESKQNRMDEAKQKGKKDPITKKSPCITY